MKKIITRIITRIILTTMLLAPLSTFSAKNSGNRNGAQQKSISRQSHSANKAQSTTNTSRPVTRNISMQSRQAAPARNVSSAGIRQTNTGIDSTGRSRTGVRSTSGHTTFTGTRVAGARNIFGDKLGRQVHGRDYARNRSHIYRYNRGWTTLGLGLGLIGSGYLDPYWNYYYGGKYWRYDDAIYGYCPYHDMDHGCYFRRTFCDQHDQYHYIWDACPM